MKYIFILVFTTFIITNAKAQRDSLLTSDPIIVTIQGMDFSQFVGLPVDSLLSHLPSGYTLQIRPSIVLKRAAYLVVKYAPSTSVYISVRNFQYMNPAFENTSTPTAHWDINLFKQEATSFVVAFNGLCFNGCENKFRIN